MGTSERAIDITGLLKTVIAPFNLQGWGWGEMLPQLQLEVNEYYFIFNLQVYYITSEIHNF